MFSSKLTFASLPASFLTRNAPISHPIASAAASSSRNLTTTYYCTFRLYSSLACSTQAFIRDNARYYSTAQRFQSRESEMTPQFVEREFFSPQAKNKNVVLKDEKHFKKGRLSLLSYARLVDMTDFIQKHRTESIEASPTQQRQEKAQRDTAERLNVKDYKSILMPGVYEYLQESDIDKLSDIQAKSLACTLKSTRAARKGQQPSKPDSVLLASQTGTGKTLAYLLPLIHNIKYDEKHLGQGIHAHRPRAVVIVPTRQLASQVHRVAKSIAHKAKFRAALFRSDFKLKRMRIDAEDADIVITTPGVWRYMLDKEFTGYSNMQYIVVDEADSMLDEKAFGKEVSDILSAAQKKNADIQYFFAMATVNHSILDWTSTFAPQAKVLASETIHRHVPTVRQSFIDCSQLDKLKDVLLPLVRKEKEQTIIFCNTVDSARAVNHYLMENGIETANFHAEIHAKEQHDEFERFRTGVVQFLITTDIASRGLDLTSVKHIINFDFPKNHVDYIHRVGRTGRMGAQGKVTSLLKKRDKGLAESIKRAIVAEQRMDTITQRTVERKDFAPGQGFSGRSSSGMGTGSGRGRFGARGRAGSFARGGGLPMRRGSSFARGGSLAMRRGSKPSSRLGKNPSQAPSPEGW